MTTNPHKLKKIYIIIFHKNIFLCEVKHADVEIKNKRERTHTTLFLD